MVCSWRTRWRLRITPVLQEYGLKAAPTRRHAFASALLKAHLRVLQVVEARNGVVRLLMVPPLRNYLKATSGSGSFRAAYQRFISIVGRYKLAKEVTKAAGRAYDANPLDGLTRIVR